MRYIENVPHDQITYFTIVMGYQLGLMMTMTIYHQEACRP